MNYYKSVVWNNILTDNILSVIGSVEYSSSQVVPLSKDKQVEIFNILKIDNTEYTTAKIMLVYLPPNTRFSIHSDKPKETKDPRKSCRCLFLPLKSCDKLTWSWYEVTDSTKVFYYGEANNWPIVPMISDSFALELDTVMCDKPFISDIGTFHSLRNDGNNSAIALSIRLMPWTCDNIDVDPILPPIHGVALA